MTSHSVLIVEDDAAIRDVFSELLKSEGHTVTLAANGEAALRLLRDGTRPCLMIVDLVMPVLDGWGFAARVAAIPALASIPFVVMSAQPERGRYDATRRPRPFHQASAARHATGGGRAALRSSGHAASQTPVPARRRGSCGLTAVDGSAQAFGPNSAAVRATLDHAAGLLPSETEKLARTMTTTWSSGRTDAGFPPFVAAVGAACHAAVRSGRIRQMYAARGHAHLPPPSVWDRAAPVALVGVRITVAALVVADLLSAEQQALLLSPWRAATSTPTSRYRDAA